MAKAKKKHTAPHQMLRELTAHDPGGVAALAERLEHEEVMRSYLDRATESIFGSIERHKAKVVAPAPPPPTKAPPRQRPQAKRVRSALDKLFPAGLDGTSAADIRHAVVRELAVDGRERGLAAPSRDTIDREIGRRRRK